MKLLLFIFFISFCFTSQSSQLPEKIVAFGDSITGATLGGLSERERGTVKEMVKIILRKIRGSIEGKSPLESLSYRPFSWSTGHKNSASMYSNFSRMWGRKDLPKAYNIAIPGSMVIDLTNQVRILSEYYKKNGLKDLPSFATLFIGGNDFCTNSQKETPTDYESFKFWLKKFFSKLAILYRDEMQQKLTLVWVGKYPSLKYSLLQNFNAKALRLGIKSKQCMNVWSRLKICHNVIGPLKGLVDRFIKGDNTIYDYLDQVDQVVERYEQIIQEVAAEVTEKNRDWLNLTLITSPEIQRIGKTQNLAPDCFHLNKAGQKSFSQLIWDRYFHDQNYLAAPPMSLPPRRLKGPDVAKANLRKTRLIDSVHDPFRKTPVSMAVFGDSFTAGTLNKFFLNTAGKRSSVIKIISDVLKARIKGNTNQIDAITYHQYSWAAGAKNPFSHYSLFRKYWRSKSIPFMLDMTFPGLLTMDLPIVIDKLKESTASPSEIPFPDYGVMFVGGNNICLNGPREVIFSKEKYYKDMKGFFKGLKKQFRSPANYGNSPVKMKFVWVVNYPDFGNHLLDNFDKYSLRKIGLGMKKRSCLKAWKDYEFCTNVIRPFEKVIVKHGFSDQSIGISESRKNKVRSDDDFINLVSKYRMKFNEYTQMADKLISELKTQESDWIDILSVHLDWNDIYGVSENMAADCFHPNIEGMKMIGLESFKKGKEHFKFVAPGYVLPKKLKKDLIMLDADIKKIRAEKFKGQY
jgi:lysophospholipase L1-like esterase